jgi:hypothetical protein
MPKQFSGGGKFLYHFHLKLVQRSGHVGPIFFYEIELIEGADSQ